MAQKRINSTEYEELHAIKLEQSPTIWCAWLFKKEHLVSNLGEEKVLKDLSKCGVYLLISPSENGHYKVYVGESANVAVRLKQHCDKPPFPWHEAMAFVSSDEYLEKSHIKYLEKHLYDILVKATIVSVQNKTIPEGAHVKDEDTLDGFIDTIKSFTQHYGYRNLFESLTSDSKTEIPTAPSSSVNNDDVPYKIGVIMNAAFREAIVSGILTSSDINSLLLPESAKKFKMNHSIPLLLQGTLPSSSKKRYYSAEAKHKGKKYYISKEFLARSKPIVIEYLLGHGMSLDDINKACAEMLDKKTSTKTKPKTVLVSKSRKIKKENSSLNQSEQSSFPYKVGRVMLFAFSYALANNLFSSKDVKYLLSRDASSFFKTRGYPVLAPFSFPHKDDHGVVRFAKKAIECRGKKYWITTQVYKDGLANILKYLNDHKLSMDKIVSLCASGEEELAKNRKNNKPSKAR